MVQAKKQSRKHTPFIILQCLMLKGNENRRTEVRRLSQELGADRLEFKTLQLTDLTKQSDLIPGNIKYSRYKAGKNGGYEIKRKRSRPCRRVFKTLTLTWGGQVVACCYDKDAEFLFGNINETSLAEIWKGDARRDFINSMLRNRKAIRICRDCME